MVFRLNHHFGLDGSSLLLAIALSYAFWPCRAQTIPPQQQPTALSGNGLYQRLSPSVFIVEAMDDKGSIVALGSAVAVSPNEVVTNTHVIDPGTRVRIRQREQTWTARVEHVSLHADLCRLEVHGLQSPPASLRPSKTVAIGEQVYAIGAPEGLEFTISGGLVSGIRQLNDDKVIQTTAAISHGSSGGGLFDGQGRLIGITTFMLVEGQNLNFALPVDSVLEPVTEQDSELIRRHADAGLTYSEAAEKFGSESMSQSLAASRSAELVLRATPSDWKAHFELGESLLIWQPHRAVPELREAIQLNPNDAEAHAELGVALGNVGDPYGGARELEEAARLAPDDWSVHVRLLNTLIDDRDTLDSLREFREAARLGPRWLRLETAWPIAYSMWAAGDADSALDACSELMQMQESRADGHYCRGQILHLGKVTDHVLTVSPRDCQRAASEFREAIQMNPREPNYRAALTSAMELCNSDSNGPN